MTATRATADDPGTDEAHPGREKVRFPSDGASCAAWHYPGDNGACIVMAAGLAVAKEPGTDLFAAAFNDAGYSVVAFDFRRLGESEGEPRQVVRIGDQQADFRAAVEFARTLPGVDPKRVAVWGFSLSGGHVFRVAAQLPDLGAAIAVSPLADGPSASPNAIRHTTPIALLRLNARALADAVGGLLGRPPLTVPLTGERGDVAALTTPDSRIGPTALNPGGRYPDWRQEVAARSALRIGFYRPARHADRIAVPLLVVATEGDGVAPPEPAIRAAGRAPSGQVCRIAGGHYAPLLEAHEQALAAQLDFLGAKLAR